VEEGMSGRKEQPGADRAASFLPRFQSKE